MTIYTAQHDAIEGKRLGLQARKFIVRAPMRDRKHGMIYPFMLGVFAVVKITEAFSPKVYKYSPTSLWIKGIQSKASLLKGVPPSV